MSPTIALEYGPRGEIRVFPVIDAKESGILLVSWPMAPPYAVHLKKNVLLRTAGSRTPIGLWRIVDRAEAWRIWYDLLGDRVPRPKHVLGASAQNEPESLVKRLVRERAQKKV